MKYIKTVITINWSTDVHRYSVWLKRVFSKNTQRLVLMCNVLNMRDVLKCFQTKTNLRQRTLNFKLHYSHILVQDNPGLFWDWQKRECELWRQKGPNEGEHKDIRTIGARCHLLLLILFPLCVVRWVHLYFPFTNIHPIGAEDCASRFHLWENSENV